MFFRVIQQKCFCIRIRAQLSTFTGACWLAYLSHGRIRDHNKGQNFAVAAKDQSSMWIILACFNPTPPSTSCQALGSFLIFSGVCLGLGMFFVFFEPIFIRREELLEGTQECLTLHMANKGTHFTLEIRYCVAKLTYVYSHDTCMQPTLHEELQKLVISCVAWQLVDTCQPPPLPRHLCLPF